MTQRGRVGTPMRLESGRHRKKIPAAVRAGMKIDERSQFGKPEKTRSRARKIVTCPVCGMAFLGRKAMLQGLDTRASQPTCIHDRSP